MVNIWLTMVKVRLTMGKALLTVVNVWLTMVKVRLRMGKVDLIMV